ncbi:predicted protein [Streptomyces pristinaespiralis ATCC 25486]|uniref:Predicted protein n=1 Tax=Streptomyces pristinaespiralis (strain ATCC 25486 / DSM 40338 / CBS 914.69 / JCM 4507 / KCC S-0507 / NBRC 13074 / NRRL 2958 / 5647) TaxID=457429 RepID=B5HG17_STRE2|nr:predicted protein [Streptomyces pristinaespiralis ATCC 25486]
MVPWLTGDEAGPESGHYVGADGVGYWSLPDNPASDRPGRRSSRRPNHGGRPAG